MNDKAPTCFELFHKTDDVVQFAGKKYGVNEVREQRVTLVAVTRLSASGVQNMQFFVLVPVLVNPGALRTGSP